MSKRIIVGISGASGALYAQRLLRQLLAADVETHLVVSPIGQRIMQEEIGEGALNPRQLAGDSGNENLLHIHPHRDVGAAIASGSFTTDGMVIVPCSSNSLSAVATGSQQNLLHRAAAVTLKERRPLVLVHREMPLSLIEVRNMLAATEAGAVVCPANPGFYMKPTRVEDLVDFVVGRVLDLLKVEHSLDVRWGEMTSSAGAADGD